MKYGLPLLIILLSTNLMAQRVRNVSRNNEAAKIKETYEVLKSDTSIKQGAYKKQQFSRLVTEGFYKNNKKDSVWSEYGYAGKLSAKCFYKDGERSGVWEFYDGNGNIESKYDFDTKKRTYTAKDKADTAKTAVINGTDTVYTKLDHPPIFAEGMIRVTLLLAVMIKYPKAALQNSTMGKVYIGITIDENGHATNYRIKKNIKDGLGEEALRVVKYLDDNWIPGKLNGKPVVSECEFPVNYTVIDQ